MKKIKPLEKKGKILIGGALILLVLIAGSLTWIFGSAVPVTIAKAQTGDVSRLVKAAGSVESEHTVTVTSQGAGRAAEIFAEEGKPVAAGDILLARDDASADLDIKSLEAQARSVRVQYDRAKETAEKNRLLYDQGVLSYESYAQSEAARDQLSASLASLEYTIAGYRENASGTDLTAPAAGVITGVFVNRGDTLMPGSPLFEISDLSALYVKTELLAEDADLVSQGQRVFLYDGDGSLLDGNAEVKKVHLKARESVSDLGIQQKRVTVEITPGDSLQDKLGRDVDVEILVAGRTNVVTVPGKAIFEWEGKDCLYKVEGGRAALHFIETGLKGDDQVEVVSGLAQGEEVILSPGSEVRDGIRVKE